MTFVVSDSDGLEILTVVLDNSEGFAPRMGTGTSLNPSFFWRMLPSDFEDLPVSDRRKIEAIWSGMTQFFSAVLAETAHLDQATGLIDHPVRVPRKWIQYELEKFYDLSKFVSALNTNLSGDARQRLLFGGSELNQTYMELTQGGRNTGAWVALGGPHIEQATVRSELRVSFRSFTPGSVPQEPSELPNLSGSTESWFLSGYGNLSKDRMSSGVYAAVSTLGRVAVMSRRDGGSMDWTITTETVDAIREGTQVDIRLWYEGARAGQPGFATVEVTSVDDPEDSAVVSAEVEGTFKAQHFVLSAPDTRVPVSSETVRLLSEGQGRSFGVLLHSLTYLDVSVDRRTRNVPILQPRVSDLEGVIVQDLDFFVHSVDTSLEKWAALHFIEQPEAILWADSVGLDNRILEKTFGPLIQTRYSSKGPDSEKFKNRLFGLLYGLLAGPHPDVLAVALSSLGGIPVAMRPGEVIAIEGPRGEPAIVVRETDHERVYGYPPLLRPVVSVGDTVQPFDILVEGVRVQDWYDGGRTFAERLVSEGIISNEVEKYVGLLVEIPYGADGGFAEDSGPASLPNQVLNYLRRAQAIWGGIFRTFFRMIARIGDDLLLDDDLSFDGLLTLRDALTRARDPRYNDGRGFLYDASGLVYNEADVEILKDRLIVRAFNDGTLTDSAFHPYLSDDPVESAGPVVADLFGVSTPIALNATAEAAEYEALPTTPWS